MKKLLLLFSILIPSLTFAQYTYYKDSTYFQTYNNLSGANSANSNLFWDDPNYIIPIGFTFHLFNKTINQLEFDGINFYGGILGTDPNFTSGYSTGIVAFGSDLVDRDSSGITSISPISYSTSGIAPNRIFKLEWRNAGFYNAIANGVSSDSVNLQLWLYEGSDIIEMRFGNGNFISPSADLYDGGTGPWVGLYDSIDVNFDSRIFYYLHGSTTSPFIDSFSSFSSLSAPPGMIGNPVSGSVYRFKPFVGGGITVGYNSSYEQVSNEINYFTEKNELRLDIFSNEEYKYTISDSYGNTLLNGTVTKGRKTISTGFLPKGIYIVKVHSDKENSTLKFVR